MSQLNRLLQQMSFLLVLEMIRFDKRNFFLLNCLLLKLFENLLEKWKIRRGRGIWKDQNRQDVFSDACAEKKDNYLSYII